MSTIERALNKQKEKQKETSAEMPAPEASDNQQEGSSIERAMSSKKQTAEAPREDAPVVETPVQATAQEEVPTSTPAEPQEEVASSSKHYIKLHLDEEKFVTSASARHLISEEMRAIKRKVLNIAFGPLSKTLNNSNVIMVSSANPSEGKTYTAVNLALSIALEQDKTVLLVDADVLRPNVMRTLGVTYETGLMEYLLGDVSDISEVMYSTNIDKLKVIPAGKSHHLSTELLASEKMLDAVNEFSSRYADRVVIVDTPPLLGINETVIMTNLAGQAVVVIEEGKTKMSELENAVNQLSPDMAKGVVINKSQRRSGNKGYGYYYYSPRD